MHHLEGIIIVGTIFGAISLISIAAMFFSHKNKKLKYQAQAMDDELFYELQDLKAANKKLQQQVENLQAIVVDSDMAQLSTGIKSDTLEFEKENPNLKDLDEDRLSI